MWTGNWLEDLLKDIRHTLRLFVANPLFSGVAILTLALGIGANTAIFSVANAVLLRALPASDAHRLFYVHLDPGQPDGASNTGNGDSSFSEYVFEQLRTRRQVLDGLIAYVPLGTNKVAIRSGDVPEEGDVAMVSGNFFSTLGVNVICGRALSASDETTHAAVAVLGYGYWSRRFDRNCSAIGRTVFVKGVPLTVIGVAPQSFTTVEDDPTDIWIPLQRRPELNAWGNQGANYYTDANWWCLRLLARLAPGVTPVQARQALDPVFRHAAYQPLGGIPRKGETPPRLDFVPARGIGESQQQFEQPLYVLLAMVALILLIACGNVGMLLAARNSARQREFSIRLAIGGSRARLFRQLLAESLVLVTSAALLGWLFAVIATRVLAVWAKLQVSLAPDRAVLLFTMGIALSAVLIFGVSLLFATLRVNVNLALKNSSATSFRGKSKSRAGRVIIILQVALCVILTVGAGLLVRTLRNLENTSLGMRTSGLLVFGIDPPLTVHSDPESIQFFGTVLQSLRALPGIQAATVMGNRPGSGWSNNTSAVIDGRDPRQSRGGSNGMRWNNVGSQYFTTLGIPIRLGRDFNDSDSASSPRVAIVNQTFADRFFKDRSPLGRQASYSNTIPYTIVGVVANSKYTGVRERDVPMAWFPFTQVAHVGALHVEVRTAGDPLAFLPAIRKSLHTLAPDLALLQPMAQQSQFDNSISAERLVARLSLFFGALAFVLVATGLYGTLAYSVSRRTSELGVRMAIGARRGQILWMIMRESVLIAVIGIALGVPVAFAVSHSIASLLFGVAASDPLSLGVAIVGILAVCLAAGFLPARRAASVDPLTALRYE